ncbi:MAG: glucosamine-6-phosphate synthase, partial [Planctomycetes bacterium]|nr:glucosamine-6-phosphate synthase [Planctomycetota bacterium]
MCGIIAVLRRASRRTPPAPDHLRALLTEAEAQLAGAPTAEHLDAAADSLGALDRDLRGVAGLWTLLQDGALADELTGRTAALQQQVDAIERAFDDGVASDADLEQRNRAMVRLKDGLWAVQRDRVPHAHAVRELAGGGELPHQEAAAAFSSLQAALSALDRLEVRGRDSAGVSVIVSGVDVDEPELRRALDARDLDPLFQNGAVRCADGNLNFVYKHAAEIGELGDNVRALRQTIVADELLQAALRRPGVQSLVLGHTRWASVGIISQPNAHPLNHEELDGPAGPYVIGALNGDVDNHHDLSRQHGLHLHDAITTDAKVIPALVSRQMRDGHDLTAAFRRTVSAFEGSVAIGAASTAQPDKLALALRGSGQALYVGLAEDTYIVASEPYGVVEDCERYLRMDGETPGNPDNPAASRGQVVVLDRAGAGEVAGITRLAYDATELPVDETHLTTAAVTTRDIDLGDHPHYLLKEIGESPSSLKKTLRGRIVQDGQRLRVSLPDSALPQRAVEALQNGRTRRVLVIGQGTAA